MKLEFYDCYEKLFFDAYASLQRTWTAKLRAMKDCRKQQREFEKQAQGKKRLDKHTSFTIQKTYTLKLVNLDELQGENAT